MILGLTLMLLAAPPAHPAEPGSVYGQPIADFMVDARRDAKALARYEEGLQRLEKQLAEQQELLHVPVNVAYTPDQKRTLLTAWGAVFDYVLSSEILR